MALGIDGLEHDRYLLFNYSQFQEELHGCSAGISRSAVYSSDTIICGRPPLDPPLGPQQDKKAAPETSVRLFLVRFYFLSRPNFLLKRLTRPPVSTIFCLPV